MEKILIVIPYLSKGAQGKEIVYAVEGWKQHFKEDCHIIIVGDYDKNVQEVFDRAKQGEPDISYIECPRITPVEGQYTCHLDHVNKFRTVRKEFPDSTGFIYACDDMYAVKDFRLADVQAPKVKSFAMTGRHRDGWGGRVDGLRPNYFAYCVPEHLVPKVEPLLPEYAGLFGVSEHGHLVNHKAPPKLHTEKLTDEQLKLAEKFYYNWVEQRRKNREHDEIVREFRREIAFYKEEFRAVTGYDISECL